MADDTIPLTPSDLVGAMQRRLVELHSYLTHPPHAISVDGCKDHLAPVWTMLDKLAEMQAAIQAQTAHSAQNGEARPQ